MSQNWIFLLIALIAGIGIPIQAVLNNKLSDFVAHPIIAVLVSFIVGTLALLTYIFAAGIPLSNAATTLKNAPWAAWTGGLIGAFYVSSLIFLIPRLGVALSFSLIIAGQMLMTVVIDHYGLLGIPVHSINWQRAFGVVLITIGVILVRRF